MGRELKPCPFCGGEAEVESDKGVGRVYSVVCGTCQVATRWWVSPDRAIAAWHQRQGVKPRNAARQVAARIMERMIGSIELDALEVDIAAYVQQAIDESREQEWVSVEERLPELEQHVLISHDVLGHVGEAHYTSEGWSGPVFASAEREGFAANPGPTHWQSLPAPPKETE